MSDAARAAGATAGVRQCDVAIVGGGLVGTSLACALAPLGYRVAVIEARPPREGIGAESDERSLALAAASCRILDGLGVWPALADGALPIREVIVSELGRPGRVRLDPAELGQDAFGHVVSAPRLGAALLERLDTLSGVEWLRPATVTKVDPGDQAVRLGIAGEDGEISMDASLLVAADGARSAIRDSLGIAARHKDYGQTAVVCHVTPEHPHGGRAFERLTPDGPFAMLPLPNGRCGLVWCVPNGDAEALLALSEAEFLVRAAERSGGELGGFRDPGRRQAWPLQRVLPERDTAARAVIVGNAAHTLHPAGAQGFNLGLRDVAVLAEVLAGDGRGRPRDPGAAALLDGYADWRRPDRVATAAFTDGLVSLFASPLGVARGLRSAALLAHALAPPLRRRLASAAMGFRGRVPRLALGEPLTPGWGPEPGAAPVTEATRS